MSNDILRRLLRNLQNTRKVYSELLELAQQKQQHIVRNNIEGLRLVLEAEHKLAGAGADLNIERENLHQYCRHAFCLNGRGDTLDDLMRFIPSEWRERFQRERIGLRRTLERLQSVNRINVTLVNNSLEMMEGLLAALFDTEKTAAYGPTGIRRRVEAPTMSLNAQI